MLMCLIMIGYLLMLTAPPPLPPILLISRTKKGWAKCYNLMRARGNRNKNHEYDNKYKPEKLNNSSFDHNIKPSSCSPLLYCIQKET